MGKHRVRLLDIAERAGVSVSTVSLVLNDKAMAGNVRISDQTVQNVRRTALAMGYLQHGTVGLILPWIWPAVEIPMIQGITEVFREAHFNLAMGVMTGRDLDVEIEELRGMDSKGFDGLIFQAGFDLMAHPELLRDNFRNWKRAVVVNQFPHDDFAYVTIDQEACGYAATQYLIAHGHCKIACARGNVKGTDRILAARCKGYQRAMKEAGLSPQVLRGPEVNLKIEKDTTAIFCSRYHGGADLLGACFDRGIRVPEDLSVVGIASDREKEVVRPRLTAVDLKAYEMGRLAAEMVLNLIDGKSVKNVVLQPLLVARESVRTL